MALQLLRRPGFLLLSEDTPLIDRHGEIHPFPLRLGIRPGEEGDIPAEHVRTMSRMEFDPKTLIDLDYIRDRLGQTVPPEAILVGERSTGLHSEIIPLSRRGWCTVHTRGRRHGIMRRRPCLCHWLALCLAACARGGLARRGSRADRVEPTTRKKRRIGSERALCSRRPCASRPQT